MTLLHKASTPNTETYTTLAKLRGYSNAIVNVSNTEDNPAKAFKLQKLKADRDVLQSTLPELRLVSSKPPVTFGMRGN